VATNQRKMPVTPEAVWAVLAEPESYADWVVGSKEIRDVEGDWPAVGSRFHHSNGWGPLTLQDHTEVLEADPPSYLRIRAKGRPLGTASVALVLAPVTGGTLVQMTENPDGPYAVLALNPVLQVFTRLRNSESLARLERLALERG
jgi:uncharacterized protein YndB with AHSA1/START domain